MTPRPPRSSSRRNANEGTQVIPFPFRAPAETTGDFPPEIATLEPATIRPLGAARPAFQPVPFNADDELRLDVASALQLLDAGRCGHLPMAAAVEAAIRKLGGDELLAELRTLANDTTARISFEVTPAGREALDRGRV